MKRKTKSLLPIFALLTLYLGIIGCGPGPDPPPPANEEEVLTTLTLNFVDSAGVQPAVSATFRDPDGDGGQGPDVFDDINLAANTTYDVTITVLNETVTPAEDITIEILEEADEHLFCFTPTGVDVTVTRTDTDGTFEVGQLSRWRTGAAGTGTVQVTLKHQPDGVKDGSCAPGDTDIEVEFATEIQ